jgi:hypothetical protein
MIGNAMTVGESGRESAQTAMPAQKKAAGRVLIVAHPPSDYN